MSKLEEVLKEFMEYKEVQPTCKTCVFYIEEENPMLDRDWFSLCTYNTSIKIKIKPHGSCRFFKGKV